MTSQLGNNEFQISIGVLNMSRIISRFSVLNRFGVLFAGLLLASPGAYGDVTVPNTFKPGSPIKSAEMNANFKSLETAVNQQAQATKWSSNSPIIITGRCTGAGTPLQNGLNAVSPVLGVY